MNKKRLLSFSFTAALAVFLTFGVNQFAFAQCSGPYLNSILEGETPSCLPQSFSMQDLTGLIASFQTGGEVTTSDNAFFQNFGSNGRTCFTCHQPQNGWSITPSTVQSVYTNTKGTDPLFAPIDGSNCPNLGAAATRPGPQFIAARGQMFNHANTRISIAVPAVHDWVSVTVVADPTGCENSSIYGLPTGQASFYRRPLPSANTAFLFPAGGGSANDIMWDAREPSLESQFVDAAQNHAQANQRQLKVLTAPALAQAVGFENGLFMGQSYDLSADDLTGGDGSGALGGALALTNGSLPLLFTHAPKNGQPGEALTFDIFNTLNSAEQPWTAAQRASIQRGQTIFNTRTFEITNVRGLNDVPGKTNPSLGACSTCHNTVDVGNDFFLTPKATGVMDSTSNVLPPASDYPVFAFLCPQGSITFYSNPVTVGGVVYDQYETTDPGVGWITGKCNDLGKMKVPALRGVGSRPPFFHGGNVPNMPGLVNFYNNRFNIGLSAQDQQDLVNFLNSL
jgi:cytochrome c peroxidase